jgi:hypothetical protein
MMGKSMSRTKLFMDIGSSSIKWKCGEEEGRASFPRRMHNSVSEIYEVPIDTVIDTIKKPSEFSIPMRFSSLLSFRDIFFLIQIISHYLVTFRGRINAAICLTIKSIFI